MGKRGGISLPPKNLQAIHLSLSQRGGRFGVLKHSVLSICDNVLAMPRKPKTDQARLPKKRRAKTPPRFMLTDRDVELVRAILKYRFLQVSQFEWLFPDASRRGMENRLRYLYHSKYLDRIVYPEATHANRLIYAMAEKGAKLLAEKDQVSRDKVPWGRHLNKVSLSHIRHLLAINDVLISYALALEDAKANRLVSDFRVVKGDASSHKIAVILKDDAGKRFEAAIVPDAVVGVKFKSGEFGLFFVEVDRATMTTKRWQDKIRVYYDYARSPELRSKFQTEWFIVLTVTTSEKRITSLAERTVAMGGKRAFWYTSADNITPGMCLERIWAKASDLFSGQGDDTKRVVSYSQVSKSDIFDAVGGKRG